MRCSVLRYRTRDELRGESEFVCISFRVQEYRGGEGCGCRLSACVQFGILTGGMGHGIAVSPEVAKRVLWACLAMPIAALGMRLYVDPTHEAHTHYEVQMPMPPHVPPPVAESGEQEQSMASS